MSLTLDTTPGSANANAYASLAFTLALALSCGAPGRAFIALSTAEQEAAIVGTAQDIDATRFIGRKTDTAQAMEWPRTGTSYASDANPLSLQRANAHEAIARNAAYATSATTDPLASSANGNVKKEVTAVLETEYFAATLTGDSLERFSVIVQNLLRPLAYVAGGVWGTGTVVRGS